MLRNKEKQARIKQEQKLRRKHREEEKLLKNLLEAEPASAKLRSQALIKARTAKSEADRLRAVRVAGLDVLELSLQNLKEVKVTPDLVILNVGDNRLERLPSLFWCASLRYLRVTNNRLGELPDLPPLEILRANRNELGRLPEVPSLRDLDASSNRLKSVVLHSELLYLNLASNQLEAVDIPLGVRDVDVSSNKLTSLQTMAPYVNARMNQLREVEAPQARHLDVSMNSLTKLPELRKIEILYAQDNALTELRLERSVAFVDASNNRIATVTGTPKRLQELRLRNNRAVLPEDVGSLSVLDCSYNDMEYPVQIGASHLLHGWYVRYFEIVKSPASECAD